MTLNSFIRRIKHTIVCCILCQLPVSPNCIGRGNPGVKTIALKEVLSIDSSQGEAFVQVGEVTTDSRDDIYVTDEYQYKVKKFDSRGRFVQSFGVRGKQPGQFQAGPYKAGSIHDTLAIVGVGSSTVQFFTPQCSPIRESHLAGVIVDFCLTNNGYIYASTIQPRFKFDYTLALYTREGDVISKLIPEAGKKDPILDMTSLCVDANDYLIVVYFFVNRVLIYDARHTCVVDCKIPSLPDQAVDEKDLRELPLMPDNIFSDVVVDKKGNILILAGPLAKHPNRDIYVVDYQGNLQTVFLLPDQSGIIYLDQKGYLFTREKQRSVVKKYEMVYKNF